MIAAICALLLCQCAGEVLVRAFALPLPGPVAGLMLLFVALVLRGRRQGLAGTVPQDLDAASDVLLRNLSLLFIPAAVGVVQYLALMRVYAGRIGITIVVSTVLALVVTAATFRLVARVHAFRRKPLTAEIESAVDPVRRP